MRLFLYLMVFLWSLSAPLMLPNAYAENAAGIGRKNKIIWTQQHPSDVMTPISSAHAGVSKSFLNVSINMKPVFVSEIVIFRKSAYNRLQ